MVEPLLAIIHGTQTIHNRKITQMESHGSKKDLNTRACSQPSHDDCPLNPIFHPGNPNYTYHLPMRGQVRNLPQNTQLSTYSNHLILIHSCLFGLQTDDVIIWWHNDDVMSVKFIFLSASLFIWMRLCACGLNHKTSFRKVLFAGISKTFATERRTVGTRSVLQDPSETVSKFLFPLFCLFQCKSVLPCFISVRGYRQLKSMDHTSPCPWLTTLKTGLQNGDYHTSFFSCITDLKTV